MSVSPVYMPTVADRLFYSSRPLLAFSFFLNFYFQRNLMMNTLIYNRSGVGRPLQKFQEFMLENQVDTIHAETDARLASSNLT